MNQTENKNFSIIGFNSIRNFLCSRRQSRLLFTLYFVKIGIRKAKITERTINLSLTWKKNRKRKNVDEIAKKETHTIPFYALPFSSDLSPVKS